MGPSPGSAPTYAMANSTSPTPATPEPRWPGRAIHSPASHAGVSTAASAPWGHCRSSVHPAHPPMAHSSTPPGQCDCR